MKTDKILNIFLIVLLLVASAGCSKVENIYEKYSPEILYKRLVQGAGGGSSWEVSPNAMAITLDAGVTEWTVRARVSTPNGLNEIQLFKVNGSESLLETYSEFSGNPNVYEVEYKITGITSQTIVRIKAIDKIGNQTVRDFTVKVQ